MNLQETVELLNTLKSTGAKYFKSNDLEVSFSSFVVGQHAQALKPGNFDHPGHVEPDTIQMKEPDLPRGFNPVDTKKAEDLIDILKMKDEDLVNKIFPAGA